MMKSSACAVVIFLTVVYHVYGAGMLTLPYNIKKIYLAVKPDFEKFANLEGKYPVCIC